MLPGPLMVCSSYKYSSEYARPLRSNNVFGAPGVSYRVTVFPTKQARNVRKRMDVDCQDLAELKHQLLSLPLIQCVFTSRGRIQKWPQEDHCLTLHETHDSYPGVQFFTVEARSFKEVAPLTKSCPTKADRETEKEQAPPPRDSAFTDISPTHSSTFNRQL